MVADDPFDGLPAGNRDERELLLSWLGYLRGAVIRDLEGLDEDSARRRPEGALIPVLGVVNHLTHVEWRWIERELHGAVVSRHESEFFPGPELTVPGALRAYRERATATDSAVRAVSSLDVPCRSNRDYDVRWVLLHVINETARHAGHADATRELLDGTTGE